jgi:hypothetical protein
MTFRVLLAAAAALVVWPPTAVRAQVTLFSTNFDTDQSPLWSVNAVTPAIDSANLFFDYGSLGIPAAPGSGGTTRGVRLAANVNPNTTGGGVTGTFSGVSVSPLTSPIPAGLTNYTLRFQAWLNAPGPFPAGGTGSTQATGGGFGATTTTPQFPGGVIDGIYLAGTGEGGATQDYRAYVSGGAPLADTSGAYAAGNMAGSTNAGHAYYAQFGNVAPPAAQTALFPQQNGNLSAGALGMAWREWVITRTGNTVTWSIDGLLIATVDVTNEPFAGNNIFLGHFDINNTTTTGADRDLLFGLIDNVVVTTPVPEPGSLALAGLAVPAWLWLRRRRA